MAGIMALIVQKTGERQGNANPALYAVATAGRAVDPPPFHDILSGSNDVPGQTGFPCGAGYDPVTGLGSVDASVLASRWESVAPPSGAGTRPRINAVGNGAPAVVGPGGRP
jgi:hypothetical protein